MFPFMGQIPGMQQDPMAFIRQLLAARQGGGSGGFQFPGQGQGGFQMPVRPGGLAALFQGQPSRFNDPQGLSRLWSSQIGPTTQGLEGWQTTTNAPNSPLGGLLGRIGGLFR